MDNLETRRLEMLIRVRDFGASRAVFFPAASRGGELFATVATVVTELETHASDQTSSTGASREGTTTKAVARAALTETLDAINLTARAIALTTPGLDDQFRLPRKATDQALLAAARSFAEDAFPRKDAFISRDMPATFIEDLNAEIAAFDSAISNKNVKTGSRVEATAAIDDAIDRGMKAAQELNAIVKNKLRDDRPALAAWSSARHVERRSGSASPAAPGSSEPPPGTPPPSRTPPPTT